MSKKAAEHHHKAAEHHEHAARHHKEAAKHHESGKHETAAHHAHLVFKFYRGKSRTESRRFLVVKPGRTFPLIVARKGSAVVRTRMKYPSTCHEQLS